MRTGDIILWTNKGTNPPEKIFVSFTGDYYEGDQNKPEFSGDNKFYGRSDGYLNLEDSEHPLTFLLPREFI